MHRQFDHYDAGGAALTVTILALEHIALWPYRGRVPQLANYALGVAALCAGQSWAAAQRGGGVLRPWGYAAAGGAVVGALHLARWLAWRRGRWERYRAAAGLWGMGEEI